MAFRIVDSKKVDMTDDEWTMYKQIVESYSIGNNNGEDLFIDLFEVDSNGIIIFLSPPSKRQTSLQVYLFLMSLMTHQHLRLMHQEVTSVCDQMKEKMKEMDEKINK
jgi:hypothetical protein